MKKILIALVLVCSLAVFSFAQSTLPPYASAPAPAALPDVVVNGFKAFMNGGYSAATSVWSLNSPLAQDATTLSNINNTFLQESSVAGNFSGAEVIRVVNFSASGEEVYAMAKYQRGTLFVSFTCYKSADKWYVTVIDVDKDPGRILPTNVMGGL